MEIEDGPFAGFLGGILYGISYAEIVRPICFGFWVSLFLVPLTNIDLKDIVTALAYITFCVASAFTIIIAAPMNITETNNISTIISVMTIAIIFGAAKWSLSLRRQTLETLETQEKKRRQL